MRPLVVLSVLLLAVILGPFVLFEDSMNRWIEGLLAARNSGRVMAAVVVSVLALDVFLPVPSSIVSTAAGALLGFAAGMAASTAGMTIGCVLGYVCGSRFGLPVVRRMVRERELSEVSQRFRQGAMWALAMMRPIPVLAEASALLSGVAGVPFARFLAVTALANAGISTVYAAVGANALHTGSFLLAFAASVGLPGCLMLARRIAGRSRTEAATTANRVSSGSADLQ